MDASSIITQVSRDDEQLNNFPEKVVPAREYDLPPAGQLGKKPRRSILRSLLCCFGGQASSKGSSTKASVDSDGRYSPQLSPGQPRYLLPQVRTSEMHKKCMVIDLDETLVHSSFKPINNADFVVPVEIDGTVHQVYVLKRPHVDEFLQRMGELYECVLFTASLAKYADPVADLLDRWGVFRVRLFRESCVFHRGNYVKDLNKLGRDLQKVIIVDNSPASYIFHPDNAVPVASWFDDMQDSELMDLIPFFEKLSSVESVYSVLCNSNHPYNSTNSPSSQLQHLPHDEEEERRQQQQQQQQQQMSYQHHPIHQMEQQQQQHLQIGNHSVS